MLIPNLRARVAWLLAIALTACTAQMTPLHHAAQSGDTAVVKQWIADKKNLDPRWDEPHRGIEGNYSRLLGVTPLMLAAGRGELEIVKLLVENGADLYAVANTQYPGDPLTVFEFAVGDSLIASSFGLQHDRLPVVDYLWRKSDGVRLGGKLEHHIRTSIITTCRTGCKRGAGTDVSGKLALYLIGIASDEVAGSGVGSSACGSVFAIDILELIERNAEDPPRNTLHCAAYQTFSRRRPFEERKQILEWMLDHGAPVDGRLHGTTPLSGAASAHDLDTVKLLVERGANPNLLDSAGIPPITGAANTCVLADRAEVIDPRTEAQLAVVQYLAPLSDKKSYASLEVLKRAYLVGQCCARQPQTKSARSVCEVFGL